MSGALSDREKACLSWTALGKSSWEIGQILSISENTVIFHIKSAMKKLCTNNRNVAAIKAVQLGLIEPDIVSELAVLGKRSDHVGRIERGPRTDLVSQFPMPSYVVHVALKATDVLKE